MNSVGKAVTSGKLTSAQATNLHLTPVGTCISLGHADINEVDKATGTTPITKAAKLTASINKGTIPGGSSDDDVAKAGSKQTLAATKSQKDQTQSIMKTLLPSGANPYKKSGTGLSSSHPAVSAVDVLPSVQGTLKAT